MIYNQYLEIRNNKASCPFHTEKTPSFTIYPKTESWYCFGCDIGGDEIDFLMRYKNIDFNTANNLIRHNHTQVTDKPNVGHRSKNIKPLSVNVVKYWHNMLGDHREYYHSRGFENEMINRELWGWNGDRYTIPVWEGEPQNSDVIGVRLRRAKGKGSKYWGLKNLNPATIWGKWYCRNAKTILGFAGEFDAALANQDGFPSFSFVNGVNALSKFPKSWPNLWFPNSEKLILVFDSKEEAKAGRVAASWNKSKGAMMSKIFHWGPFLNIKDYCEFREFNSLDRFVQIVTSQLDWRI